jgi:carbon-monoxide dehydrogenase medium subunit/xanthine dehydrogenase FAD-binding subunit
MISYEFLTTQKIEESLNYLDKFSKVYILAGGTDLLVNLYKESSRLPDFDYLLDISNIPELKRFVTVALSEVILLMPHRQQIFYPL